MKRLLTRTGKSLLAIVLLLSCLVVISGCSFFAEPVPLEESPEEAPAEDDEPTGSPATVPIVNDKFTLRYNPNASMNPITGTDTDNLLVTDLMYEGLFALDSSFVPYPVLCDTYETDDFMTYTFTIRQGIKMSDGTELTAADAAYTIGRACSTGRFVNRLKTIESIEVVDETDFTITLTKPNSRFIKLLDIPIIKHGGIESEIPIGTGPYILAGGGEDNLVRFSGHRDYPDLPIGVVYLRECTNEELIELFSDGIISVLKDDLGGVSDFYISRRHETRYYNTTTLQFLGFNGRNAAMRDPNLRRAIGFAVDRSYIAETIMMERAVEAPLVLPSAYALYDKEWTPKINPDLEISRIFSEIGLADSNDDSFLEYPNGNGGFTSFSIDFIVNNDNAYKTEAADRIATVLKRVGIDINVRKLSWNGYLQALESGDFDIYYGETVLPADYDLSILLAPGAPLDFGGIGDLSYVQLIDEFLAARTREAERTAAQNLCTEIWQNAPIVPVLYKKHAMHSVRGVVSDAAPGHSGVFQKLTEWTIKPGGLSAE